MAKFEVLQKSYINDREVYPGEIVEYKGKPGTNLRAIGGKEKALKQMSREELLEFAQAHDVELKDIDNLTDGEIIEAIQAKQALEIV